jgi:hypothetical protein
MVGGMANQVGDDFAYRIPGHPYSNQPPGRRREINRETSQLLGVPVFG